jgi:hypothetical protein
VFSVRLWLSFESDALYPQIIGSRKGGKGKSTFMFGVGLLGEACELADQAEKMELIW